MKECVKIVEYFKNNVSQRQIAKALQFDGMGCISAYVMGSLHVLEGTMNAEMYIKLLE